jgi:tetratricopeptide (TPR) repeat protein
MRHSKALLISSCALMLALAGANAWAEPPSVPPVPYNSYNYGVWDSSIPAEPAYQPAQTLTGADLGVGALKNPTDLCADTQGNIYVLDNGNKRVIELDAELNLVRVVDRFSKDGLALQLKDPKGLCVDFEGRIYLADRGLQRVFIMDKNGRVLHEIAKPETDLIEDSVDFLPDKVLTDKAGVLYVLSFGIYQGAMTFDRDGNFLGFYGSNKVNVDAKLKADQIWRHFMTKAQRSRMYRYVPVEYSNFALDQEGFIYTVSNFGDAEQRGQVKKLNPLSQNILWAGAKPNLMFFGDWEQVYTNRIEKSSLVAVDVDTDNFINVLDFERGRVFQYDQDCNLIAIFGGPGDQMGTFKHAADLVSSKGKIIVLDEVKGNLTSFEPTRYGEAIHQGTILYENGEYEKALTYWFNALKLDRDNHLTLRGIGRAYERLGRYWEAMKYFQEAQYHGSYSQLFREWRTEFLRKYFGIFMFCLLLVIASPFIIGRVRKRYFPKKEERVKYVSKWRFPFYLIVHPFKGWDELKNEKQGSLLIANLILLGWFIMSIVEFQFTGFQFNYNKLDEMNVLVNIASTVGIFFLWCVANWGITTLMDGKGNFKEVWIFSAYALLTTVLAALPVVIITNVLARDEGFFLNLITFCVQAWTVVQMFLAITAVHQYTPKKTIGALFLTLLGIVLIVVIILLFVALFSQVYTFGNTIFQEILLRM